MTASAGAPPRAAAIPAIPLRHRIYGFGSIYGKTIRDSRLAFIIAAGLLGGMALVMGAAVSQIFPTPQARLEVDKLVAGMPAEMLNLFGNTTAMGDKIGTLGGYMTFKYGAIFALGTALWSIFALSGTLAGEARRGSLDLIAASPYGKRRIALEKVAAHLTLLALTMVVLAVGITVSSNVFGEAELGDAIPPLSSVGFALWCGFLALCFGGLAFALSPLLGRAGSAGIAALSMAVLWVITGLNVGGSPAGTDDWQPLGILGEILTGLAGIISGALLAISPFTWTFNHIPLVGIYDWLPLALVGIIGLVLLAAGVELFVRRDLGVTVGLSLPGLPAAILGVRGPTSRAFGDQLPRAVSWGIGLGLFGLLFASLAGPMSARLDDSSNLLETFAKIFPGFDLRSVGGWLQLYVELLYIAAGFAGATLVARWASDEEEGRLETVLTTPVTRARWVISGGIAALFAIVVMTVLFSAGVGLGAVSGGLPVGDAMLGTAALGVFAAAIVGVGFAIGGLWRTSLAAEIAALVVVGTYLINLLAPPLKLPDWVHQLALTAHLGRPMVGEWDPVGIVASLGIFVGGVLLGAWGFSRRDVAR